MFYAICHAGSQSVHKRVGDLRLLRGFRIVVVQSVNIQYVSCYMFYIKVNKTASI